MNSTIRLLLIFALTITGTAVAHAQTSITLAQIVDRQQRNHARIRSAEGQVIWVEQKAAITTHSLHVPPSRVILFAFQGDRSVNLVLPYDPNRPAPASNERIDWTHVLAAYFINADSVHQITLQPGARLPSISTTAFNPAVHESNPLVAFHPRMLADEPIGLRELLNLVPQMHNKPRVTELNRGGRTLLRVDFYNESARGEAVSYLIAPDKGYLPEEITRMSGGKMFARTVITPGQTKDGTWIAARRERAEYDTAGRTIERQSWSYRYLAVNEPLAPRLLTFEFFHLPEGVRRPVVSPPTPSSTAPPAAPPATPAATQPDSRQTPRATSTAAIPRLPSGPLIRTPATPTPRPGPRRY